MYAPPLTITKTQVDELIAILDESIAVAEAEFAEDFAP